MVLTSSSRLRSHRQDQLDWRIVRLGLPVPAIRQRGKHSISDSAGRGSQGATFKCNAKFMAATPGGNAWSNDGYFVYGENISPPEKESVSCPSCTPGRRGYVRWHLPQQGQLLRRSGIALATGLQRVDTGIGENGVARWKKVDLASQRNDLASDPWFGGNERTPQGVPQTVSVRFPPRRRLNPEVRDCTRREACGPGARQHAYTWITPTPHENKNVSFCPAKERLATTETGRECRVWPRSGRSPRVRCLDGRARL